MLVEQVDNASEIQTNLSSSILHKHHRPHDFPFLSQCIICTLVKSEILALAMSSCANNEVDNFVLGFSGISHKVTPTAGRWRKRLEDLVVPLAEQTFVMVAAWHIEDNGDVVCLR